MIRGSSSTWRNITARSSSVTPDTTPTWEGFGSACCWQSCQTQRRSRRAAQGSWLKAECALPMHADSVTQNYLFPFSLHVLLGLIFRAVIQIKEEKTSGNITAIFIFPQLLLATGEEQAICSVLSLLGSKFTRNVPQGSRALSQETREGSKCLFPYQGLGGAAAPGHLRGEGKLLQLLLTPCWGGRAPAGPCDATGLH